MVRIVSPIADDERTGPLLESGDIIIQRVPVNSGFCVDKALPTLILAASSTQPSCKCGDNAVSGHRLTGILFAFTARYENLVAD